MEEGAGAAGMSRGVGGGQGRRASTGGLEYFRGTNFIYIMGIILLAKSKLEGESECEVLPPPQSPPPLHPTSPLSGVMNPNGGGFMETWD